MTRRTQQTQRARGYTLVEMMITVAIIGIGLASAWSVWGTFDAPDRPGHMALNQDRATAVLISAHQQALATDLSGDVGQGERAQPSNHAAIRLSRTVTQAQPGLLRIEWTARWRGHRESVHSRQLTALKRVAAKKGAP